MSHIFHITARSGIVNSQHFTTVAKGQKGTRSMIWSHSGAEGPNLLGQSCPVNNPDLSWDIRLWTQLFAPEIHLQAVFSFFLRWQTIIVFAFSLSLLGYIERRSRVKCRAGQLWLPMVQRLAMHMTMQKSSGVCLSVSISGPTYLNWMLLTRQAEKKCSIHTQKLIQASHHWGITLL